MSATTTVIGAISGWIVVRRVEGQSHRRIHTRSSCPGTCPTLSVGRQSSLGCGGRVSAPAPLLGPVMNKMMRVAISTRSPFGTGAGPGRTWVGGCFGGARGPDVMPRSLGAGQRLGHVVVSALLDCGAGRRPAVLGAGPVCAGISGLSDENIPVRSGSPFGAFAMLIRRARSALSPARGVCSLWE